jgi:hypothetical protein
MGGEVVYHINPPTLGDQDFLPGLIPLAFSVLTPLLQGNKICNHRQDIGITNPSIKILGNLITNWIEKRYKGNEEQSGFAKG